MRCEIYLQQEQWREAYDGLLENAPDFLKAFWTRFGERAISYFYMLGRSAEGLGAWETARRYYANTYFAPTPHVEAQTGLKRVYDQMDREETTDTFEAFLKDTEAEYRIRESADREKIRQKLIANRLNKKAADFRLETLDGECYTLSEMSGKVVLLDVGTTRCGGCDLVVPEVKKIYEQFSENDDVVVWGINTGETPHLVQAFIDQHQPPWPVLFDPHQEVKKAYQIEPMPSFLLLIDKAGNWEYSFDGLFLMNGQPLIWMIEALLSD